jgi:uncharacterized protein (TIGR00162 family)
MVCEIEMFEKPQVHDALLIEGLPGIGFVANIAALHMIHELKAKRFAEIHSSSFQDLVVTTESGGTRSPINELYYSIGEGTGSSDLIFWYGNTQALTTSGQYELCGRVLDTVKQFGCKRIVTLGGFKQDEVKPVPQIYTAASDSETLNEVLGLGAKVMVGQIFGVAGLLVGLGRIKGFRGYSLLVETLGTYPDANGARRALIMLNKYLKMNIDLSKLDLAVEETKKVLESFGLLRTTVAEKKREEQPFRWFI